MTKEQLIAKWGYYFNDYFIADLNAVIDNEIAKVQEPQPIELKGNCSTFDMSRLVDQPQPAQPSSQVKVDNSFDKERFEAMFRAVVASGKNKHWGEDIIFTKWALEQIDAYYATKEGGKNE